MKASAINHKLYGICRELGHCVDDCGLCAKIAGGVRAEPVLKSEPEPKSKLPKATPVVWHDICDWCRRKRGGHYPWCRYK